MKILGINASPRGNESNTLQLVKAVLKGAESEKDKAEQARHDAEKKAEKQEQEATEHRARANRLNSRLEQIETDLRSARDKNQVMERDLAAVRSAIGEIRMKEILAARK